MSEDDNNNKKAGWYPGKYIRRASVAGRSSSTDEGVRFSSDHRFEGINEHEDEQTEGKEKEDKTPWYPGKIISKRLGKVSSPGGNSHKEGDEHVEDHPKSLSPNAIKDEVRKLDILESEILNDKPLVPKNSFGKVRVHLHRIRYYNFSRASVLVELDGSQAFYDLSSGQQSIMEDVQIDFAPNLAITSFPSDIVITLNGKTTLSVKGTVSNSENNVGVVVLPLVNFVSMFGVPLKPTPQWVCLSLHTNLK